jgi:hypothetical protein
MEAFAGLRAWPGRDCECPWITGLAFLGGVADRAKFVQDCVGLRDVARWSGYHADLCRPGGTAQQSRDPACVDRQLGRSWGRGLAEWRLCRPVQALGPGLAEIVNVCGSLAWQVLRARLSRSVQV